MAPCIMMAVKQPVNGYLFQNAYMWLLGMSRVFVHNKSHIMGITWMFVWLLTPPGIFTCIIH